MLPVYITAVGGLGTAAFGLVDSFKALPGGGVSRAGLKFIRSIVAELTPPDPAFDQSGLSRDAVINTLTSQWINGTAFDDQVNIAKAQVKLRLSTTTAPSLAKSTGVDAGILTAVAASIVSGTSLTPQQSDVYGRFDLMLTTLLDQAYQRADQRYRNVSKLVAVPVSVFLALAAHAAAPDAVSALQAALLGLIATPLAPIAKDLSTAIANSAQALQSIKG
jgi:hypothetical protein